MEEIRAAGITKQFGDVTALNNVSLEIAPGELFFLLGGSGCGKTTLLRCIAGLETPTEGKIFFGERDVTALPTHKREAAMVFQSYALWPHMTVGQNIAFGLEERKVDKKEIQCRVEEALAMVKLEGFTQSQYLQCLEVSNKEFLWPALSSSAQSVCFLTSRSQILMRS